MYWNIIYIVKFQFYGMIVAPGTAICIAIDSRAIDICGNDYVAIFKNK